MSKLVHQYIGQGSPDTILEMILEYDESSSTNSFIHNVILDGGEYIYMENLQEREINHENFEEINNKLLRYNLTLIFALSFYKKQSSWYNRKELSNIKFFDSPLYFLNFLVYKHYENKNYNIDNVSKSISGNYKSSLFINLNNKPHDFRCEMMDTLSKYDLLSYGNYSWLMDGDVYDYEFKYFDNKYKKLTIDSKQEGWSWYWHDITYGNPLINLVTESDDDIIGISEKTCKPLLVGQPFITYSYKGFHKTLEEFGFELYDEIFDYSFDSKETRTERILGICENLDKLKNKDYNKLYNLISDKLERNRQTALNIAKTNKFTNPKYLEFLSNNSHDLELDKTGHAFFNLYN